jgi:hypothetical protein
MFLTKIPGRDLLFKTVYKNLSKFRLCRRLLCVVKSVSDWGTGLVPLYSTPVDKFEAERVALDSKVDRFVPDAQYVNLRKARQPSPHPSCSDPDVEPRARVSPPYRVTSL